MIKKFIIQFGELIINVLVGLGLFISVIGGISAMTSSFIFGLITLVSGVAVTTLFAFVVYILIDIRDQLKQLNNK